MASLDASPDAYPDVSLEEEEESKVCQEEERSDKQLAEHGLVEAQLQQDSPEALDGDSTQQQLASTQGGKETGATEVSPAICPS